MLECHLNAGLNFVRYSDHHLNTGQVKVLYSDVCYSDPHRICVSLYCTPCEKDNFPAFQEIGHIFRCFNIQILCKTLPGGHRRVERTAQKENVKWFLVGKKKLKIEG